MDLVAFCADGSFDPLGEERNWRREKKDHLARIMVTSDWDELTDRVMGSWIDRFEEGEGREIRRFTFLPATRETLFRDGCEVSGGLERPRGAYTFAESLECSWNFEIRLESREYC